MQISVMEKAILSAIHELPVEKQQAILDFSLFLQKCTDPLSKLTNSVQKVDNVNIENTKATAFRQALRQFIKEVKEDPIEIDTHIFDNDRETESGRDFEL